MAAQIRRDLYADVTSRKRPAEAMAASLALGRCHDAGPPLIL